VFKMEQYVVAETESCITAIHIAVIRAGESNDIPEMFTLLEMAANLSTLALKLVLQEGTQEDQELWIQIVEDVDRGLKS
jgi:hypothetical protein